MKSGLALGITATTTVLLLGAVAVIAAVGRPVPSVVEPRQEASYVEAQRATSDGNQEATLVAELTDPVTVLSPGGSGIVTSVHVQRGDKVVAGTPLYDLDGKTVFAYVSELPLYRSLAPGSKGEDVHVLQGFLRAYFGSESAAASDGVFGSSLLREVHSWQKSAGLAPADTIEPTSLVRISGPLTVGSISVSIGEPAPGVGETVLVSTTALTSLNIETPGVMGDGNYSFIREGAAFPLTYTAGSWTTPDPAALLAAISQPAGSGGVAPGATADASSIPGDGDGSRERRVAGRVALSSPVPAVAVPATSLVASASGSASCVWTETASGTPARTQIVVVAVAPSGAVLTSNMSLEGQKVLLSPASVLADGATCP